MRLWFLTAVSLSLALIAAFEEEDMVDHLIGLILLIVVIYAIAVYFLTKDDDP
jgi:membrane protein DedA with SNARE-associated domain